MDRRNVRCGHLLGAQGSFTLRNMEGLPTTGSLRIGTGQPRVQAQSTVRPRGIAAGSNLIRHKRGRLQYHARRPAQLRQQQLRGLLLGGHQSNFVRRGRLLRNFGRVHFVCDLAPDQPHESLDPLDIAGDRQLEMQLREARASGHGEHQLVLGPRASQARDVVPRHEARLHPAVWAAARVEGDADVADEQAAQEPLLVAEGGHAHLPPQQDASLRIALRPLVLLLRQGQPPRPGLGQGRVVQQRLQGRDVLAEARQDESGTGRQGQLRDLRVAGNHFVDALKTLLARSRCICLAGAEEGAATSHRNNGVLMRRAGRGFL
mmetsp:Transcript_80382/g.230703  ORF Transcript_80382/g.230703 Transcript_80382/m.230703 type:complete len:319 (-) Transcript_80382:32-988(-)